MQCPSVHTPPSAHPSIHPSTTGHPFPSISPRPWPIRTLPSNPHSHLSPLPQLSPSFSILLFSTFFSPCLSLSLFSPKPFDSNSFLSPLLSSPLLLLPFSSLHAVYPFPPRRRAGAVTSRTSLSRVFLFLNRLPWRREGWREILKERSSFSTGVCRQSSKHPARNRRTRFITHDEQTVDGLGRGLAACVSFAERLIVALRSV